MSSRGGFEVYFWNSFREMLADRISVEKKVIHSPYSRKGNKILSGTITQAQNAIKLLIYMMMKLNLKVEF